MSETPLFPQAKTYTVPMTTTLGSLALMFYRDVPPVNQLTPHKWLAVYLANHSLPGWYLDPNMEIAAGGPNLQCLYS